MGSTNASVRPVVTPGRFLLARWLVGLLAAGLIGLQGAWLAQQPTVISGLVLAIWLSATTVAMAIAGRGRHAMSAAPVMAMLLGDCIATAVVVRAAGSLYSPTLLLMALPVLGGGLVFQRPGLLLGLFASLLYALIGFVDDRDGMLPRALWSLVAFHTLLFTSMGAAAGLLGRQMAASLREADETRTELAAVRLSTDRIFAALTCGLIAVDATGAVRTVNPEARRLLGLSGLDGPDQAIAPALAERNQELMAMLAAGLAEERPAEAELWLTGASGERFPAWVKLSPVGVGDGQPHGLVALISDLTEYKRLEALARQRERLAMVGELSAGLAHEIRNSLKPITGSIELLQDRMRVPPPAVPLMELITREAASLEAFLSQFLTLARDKTLKLEDIDLEDLLETEARALRVGLTHEDEPIRIVTGSTGQHRLRGDREWLRQVFRNVILNAIEADPQGRVEARLEQFERDGQAWIRARIVDHGPGLAGVDHREAFLPFRTTKPGGSGLGLPIAQRGVEEHGGRIAFDTSWPTGGCVIVELPESRMLPEVQTGRAA
jgi:PAS domain S-box-containing protein